MKKITYFVLMTSALLLCMSAHVSAESLTAAAGKDGLYIENYSQRAVINFYKDGRLVQSTPSESKDGGLFFDVPQELYECDMRAVFFDGSAYDVELKSDLAGEQTDGNGANAAQEPTQPSKPSYPEVYEKSSEATHAPALIEKVETTALDGEIYYRLTMLYQGEEIQTDVRDWVEMETAPRAFASMIGQSASSLKAGDVIHFTCDMQHQIKSIDLIYRPEFADYIGGGISLKGLVGADGRSQYYFGVPVETGKGYMILADDLGNTSEIILDAKTFVYTVSGNRKNVWCELAGPGHSAVTKTYIPRSGFDDDGRVISWENVEDKTYALARVTSDKATEVFVFISD